MRDRFHRVLLEKIAGSVDRTYKSHSSYKFYFWWSIVLNWRRKKHERIETRQSAARRSDQLQGLGAGGRDADVDEQPRPGGRRAPRRPGRLRRRGQGGPRLAVLRRHRAQPARFK